MLCPGLRGIVRLRDADGDAVVRFPRLPGVSSAERFVRGEDFARLRKRAGPRARRALGSRA